MIVDDTTGEPRQQVAALFVDAKQGQPWRAGNVEPLRASANPEAGLVEMLHRRLADDQVPHMVDETLQLLGHPAAHRRQRRGAHGRVEQVGHQLRQTILGQEMRMVQIGRHRRHARTILHRRRHACGKRRPCRRAAMTANATVSAVFRGLEGARLRQVEDLSCDRASIPVRSRQRRAAARTVRRMMILDMVRPVGPAQGRARVPGLPAARPARFAALAPCPGLRPRLLQPVTRRRLAAVPAVPAKLPLQLFKTLPQGRVLGLQTSELLVLLFELLPQSLNLFRSAIIMRRRPLRQVGRR